MSPVLAYITAKDKAEADLLASQLLEKRLAACVNILSQGESHFWWEGKLEQASERVLLVKTVDSKKQAICDLVEKVHSYACPCVIFLPIEGGNPAFLEWITQQVLGNEK